MFSHLIALLIVCNAFVEAQWKPNSNQPVQCGCDSQLNAIQAQIQLMRNEITDLNTIKSEVQLMGDKITGELQRVYVGCACPPGFTYIAEVRKCYKVVYENLDWTSAGLRCQQLHPDAHLVTIATQQEDDAVKTFLRTDLQANSISGKCNIPWVGAGQVVWTSLRRTSDDCNSPFVWKMPNGDQLPLNLTDWRDGEPSCSNNDEYCGHLVPTWEFLWNDTPCYTSTCSLCEYEVV